MDDSRAAGGLSLPQLSSLPEDQWGGRSGLHAMAPPYSQCRQGAGVAASRSWSPGMTTNHACTQLFVTSPTWESPRCPHPSGQEKYPEHQPIHEDFTPSGLKGSGEGRGKSTRSNVGSKMRSFFGQKKKEERKAGR